MLKYCNKCGSKYELTEHSIMFRDKDSLDCDICGEEIIRWNGGCIWSSKLLEKCTIPFASEEPRAQ